MEGILLDKYIPSYVKLYKSGELEKRVEDITKYAKDMGLARLIISK